MDISGCGVTWRNKNCGVCIVSSGGLHVNKDYYDDDDEWRTVLEKGAGNAMRSIKRGRME